ncbi:MAG TPA: YncE family protein [Verrucomicrobiae bacterium]|jgi:DNA-binding beta-propeller fold protein YncE
MIGLHMITLCRRIALALLAAASLCLPSLRADDLYSFTKEIRIGGEGGWDYLSIDAPSRRLYVSHATKVIVIDTDKDEVVGQITGTQGVHGIAIASPLHRGFSSNGRENNVSVIDLGTLKTMMKVNTGENPDCIIFEPGRQEVYAFNGRGSSATVIDAASAKVVATIPLPGKPEFAAADPNISRVFCNIEDKNEVVSIDTMKHQIANTWPIAPGKEASGMAIDTAHQRLFIGCHNKLMEMLDCADGRVLATVPITPGVDANSFDPVTGLAFASCGDGMTTIARMDGPNKLTVAQSLSTRRGARTMALDPSTHKIYLATTDYESQEDQPEGTPAKRPRMIPNTFKVLVYGLNAAAAKQ